MNPKSLRRWHRIVSVVIAVPLALIIVTGLVLQLRNQFEAIQPATVKTENTGAPLLKLEDVLAKVEGQVDQVIYRPEKHALAVRMKDGMEVQIHPQTGEILKRAPRMTNFLIDLHQGSFLGPWSQFGLFILTGWGLLFLLVSGLYIFPWKKKV